MLHERLGEKHGRAEPANGHRWASGTSWQTIALLLCTGLCAVLLLRGVLQPHRATTYPFFRNAARNWRAGHDLYQEVGSTCRYSPLFHALLVPFAMLPDWLGGSLWRLLNQFAFFGSLLWWCHTLLPRDLSDRWRGLALLSTLPLALGSLDDAQANPLMVGAMLAAVTAIARGAWNLAAFGLAVAFFLKIYPLALALLLLPLYPRRLVPRLLIFLAAGLALPFLLQDPGYVARQYGNWLTSLEVDDRTQIALYRAYRDLWLLIRLTHLPIGWGAYHVIQVAGGVFAAGLVMLMYWRGVAAQPLLNITFGLAACWIALLGPATESSTYIVLAPTLAWCLVDAWYAPRSYAICGLVLTSFALFLLARLAGIHPEVAHLHSYGPHPIAALSLLTALIALAIRLSFPVRGEKRGGMDTTRQAA